MEAVKLALSVFNQRQKLRLLPFVVSSMFFMVQPYPTESFWGAIFKILPILSLIIYVMLTRSKFPLKTKAISMDTICPEDTYSFCILCGLTVSLVGDILVTIPYMMFLGGFVFMITHMAYFVGIEVSGRHRSGKSSSVWLYALLFLNMLLCIQGTTESYFTKIFIAVYLIPLFLTGWKAAAALEENPGDKAVMFGCLGASLFILSDFLVILDHNEVPIPLAEHLFMFTYYGAQFCWTVSTSNFH